MSKARPPAAINAMAHRGNPELPRCTPGAPSRSEDGARAFTAPPRLVCGAGGIGLAAVAALAATGAVAAPRAEVAGGLVADLAGAREGCSVAAGDSRGDVAG